MRLVDLGALAVWTHRTRNSLRRLHQRGVIEAVACDVKRRRLLYDLMALEHLVLPLDEAEQALTKLRAAA